MRGGAIEDYTYLWWDVRPHPNLGTVETRIFDQQTRLEHTIGLAALTDLARPPDERALRRRRSRWSSTRPSWSTTTRSARPCGAWTATLIDFWRGEQVPAEQMARGVLDELADHAAELGCSAELALRRATCSSGQHRRASASFALGARTAGPDDAGRARWSPTRGLEPRGAGLASPAPAILVAVPEAGPELSVVCKSCGSEVSPYVTECPYCGTRLRKRAPKLERRGDELKARESRARPPASARRRAPGQRAASGLAFATERPYVTIAAILGPGRAPGRPARRGPEPVPARRDRRRIAAVANPWWHYLAAPFVYDDLGYLFVIGLAMALFVPELERRLGPVPTALLLVACGALGRARGARARRRCSATASRVAAGGNGIALGAVGAWFMLRRADARDDPTEEFDWIPIIVAACVLLLLPLVDDFANPWAGIVGGLVGLGAGFSATLGRR